MITYRSHRDGDRNWVRLRGSRARQCRDGRGDVLVVPPALSDPRVPLSEFPDEGTASGFGSCSGDAKH